MNQAKLPEVASWVGITQGTNSMKLHAVLYSTADKNMVYFCKTRPPVSFVMSKFLMWRWLYGPFEIYWYIALLPNPIGSTAKTSLPWHTIPWMHFICSSLRALWTKLSREAFKADENSLSSLASSDVMMNTSARGISLVLSTFCFLTNQSKVQILDQQQTNSQVIVSGVPSRRENKGMPDRRLVVRRISRGLLQASLDGIVCIYA